MNISTHPLRVRLRTAVRDHGPGLPRHFRSRLFEKFSHVADANLRVSSGSELGLAITMASVEQQGGRFGHEYTTGCGALLWFEAELHG